MVFAFAYFRYKESPPRPVLRFLPVREGALKVEIPSTIIANVPFEAKISVDPNKQSANAVALYLQFDSKNLEVVDIDTTTSFCQFYPEKKFDNNIGRIQLACGAPHPGVNVESELIKIKFIPKILGTTSLVIDSRSQILLSNGKGTNILTDTRPITFTVVAGI